MLSNEQQTNINKRILKLTRMFLDSPCSIETLSKRSGYSKSTVQRALTDNRIINLLGKEIYDEIQEQLKYQKQEGLSKGGTTSTSKYEYERDENAKFKGIKR